MKTLIAAAALALAACATTSTSGTHYYRANDSATPVSISGTLVQSIGLASATNDVSILFNGAKIAGGTFSGGSATFSGTHDGKPVLADCSAIAAGSFSYQLAYGFDRTDVKCSIFVAGQIAASLLLVP